MEDRTEGDAGVRSTQYPVQGTEDDVAEQPGERRGGHRFEENWSPPVGPRVTEPGSSRGLLLCTVAGTNIEIHADAWLERDSDVRIGVVRAGDAKDDDAEDELVVPVGRGLSDLFVSVVLPELGTGGVVTGDGRWLARLDSSAQRTLRADAWNDVRVRLAKGRLTVQVNGWPAVDALMDNVLKKGDRHLADPSIPQGLDSNSDPVPVFQQAAGAYRCALVTPNDGSEGRWRFVRTRVLPENARPFSREAQPSATQVRAAQSTERDVDEHEVRDGQVDVSRREDGGWKIEDRTERAGQVGKPALPQILAAWVERQGRLAEGRLAEGQFEWQVLRRNQSESFGTLASTSEDAGENDRTGEMMTISFDKHGFRLDGESVPSVGLKQRAWAAASGSSGAAADHAAFQAALRNRFSEFGSSMPESLTSVPYRVLVDATREVHAWDVGNAPLSGNARSLKRDSPLFQQKEQTGFGETRLHYPRAIVLAAGTAQQALGTDSLSAVPLYSGLVEAFQIAVRPLFRNPPLEPRPSGSGVEKSLPAARGSANSQEGDGRNSHEVRYDGSGEFSYEQVAERFRVLPDCPLVDGAPCVVVEERLGDDWDGRTRRLWVDPSRGHAIVRCLHLLRDKLDGAQFDIEYDQDESGLWLPRTISVLRMSSLGDPLDAISVVRRRAAWRQPAGALKTETGASNVSAQSTDATDLLAWEPGPGTWVDDYVDNKQYFVRADGSRRSIAFSENYAGLTYADLLAEGGTGWAGLGFATLRFRTSLATITKKAVTWPGILVTLPAVYLLWKGGRRGYNRWRRTGF